LIERGFEIAHRSIEFSIRNVHAGMGRFHFFAIVMGRPAACQRQELLEVLFKTRHIFWCRIPSRRFFMVEQPDTCGSLSIPIYPRILQSPWDKIFDDGRNSFLSPEPLE